MILNFDFTIMLHSSKINNFLLRIANDILLDEGINHIAQQSQNKKNLKIFFSIFANKNVIIIAENQALTDNV